MEDYPSLAEGNGLENRQACKSVRGFESHILLYIVVAGWSSSVARRAHNPKVVGSNPTPATTRLGLERNALRAFVLFSAEVSRAGNASKFVQQTQRRYEAGIIL